MNNIRQNWQVLWGKTRGASIFQTLGIRTKKNATIIDTIGKAYTLFIWVGFISIPVSVLAGWIH